jgi:predicted metal-binding membrane protein
MPDVFGAARAHGASTAFLPLTLMWVGMMAAMMAPTVWPWVQAFHRLADAARSPVRATFAFVVGYVAAWSGYALAAAAAQTALASAGVVDPLHGLEGVLGSVVLIVAGLYQFAPLKRACLTHCRSPFSYLLARWRNGPGSGFRIGLGHGIYCVGCCWALMATALAVGMASVWWMAAIGLATFVEQVVAHGDRARVPLGVLLIAAGIARG